MNAKATTETKYTPSDIVRVMRDMSNDDTRINEAIDSASMDLDWSDTPDKEREATETAAVALMLSAPELLAALKGMLEWARRVKEKNPGMEVFNAIAARDRAEGK